MNSSSLAKSTYPLTSPEPLRLYRPGLGSVLLMAALASAAGCDDADEAVERDALTKALDAMGGRNAVAALTSITAEATGSRSVLDEGVTPGGPAMEWGHYTSTMHLDIAQDRLAIDYTRDITAPILGGGTTITASEVVRGDVGVLRGQNSLFAPPSEGHALLSDRVASLKAHNRLAYPHLLFQEILADPSLAQEGADVTRDGRTYHTLTVAIEPAPITLFIDAETGVLNRGESMINDFLRRDSALAVSYRNWQASGELTVPMEVELTVAGEVLFRETRMSVAFNDPASTADELFVWSSSVEPSFDATLQNRGMSSHPFFQGFVSIGSPRDGTQPNAPVAIELAPGIFHLLSSHNSLAIVQSEGLVIVEAPMDEVRSQAIIEWARATFPEKPITHVISTHHHVDHSAGLRAFVANGTKVVLHEASRALFTEVFAAPSTLLPDQLQTSPRTAPAEILSVPADAPLILEDALQPVHVYPVPTSHADDMVIAYAPGPDIVFVSDIYNPGLPLSEPGTKEDLHRTIVDSELSVALIAGGHGGTATLADLEAELAP